MTIETPKFCPNCGTPTSDQPFCTSCGKPLETRYDPLTAIKLYFLSGDAA